MVLTKNKKNFIILAGALSLFLFSGGEALAAGIVPCGGTDCTLCDLFKMVENIVNQIFYYLVPSIAVLLVVYGGFLLITARGDGNSENVKKAKAALTAVAVGLLIIYGSYIAVNEILRAVGVKTVWQQGWYQIDCQ
ncbi:MAG: hypothetical protein WCX77_02735 [Candidatus Paceibacterota bacterium]|jgi:hypothetical protein